MNGYSPFSFALQECKPYGVTGEAGIYIIIEPYLHNIIMTAYGY